MLAGTISQVAFALAYGSTARRGTVRAFLAGSAAFAAATVACIETPCARTGSGADAGSALGPPDTEKARRGGPFA